MFKKDQKYNIHRNYALRYSFLIILLFNTTIFLASDLSPIDSLRNLLVLDSISVEDKVDIRTKLILKLRYRTEESLNLLNLNDSICAAEGLTYKQGKNAFRKTIYYNRKRQYDSIYLNSIKRLEDISKSLEDPEDLIVFTNRAYANYYFGLLDHAKSESYLKLAIEEAHRKGLDKNLASLYNEIALRQKLQSKFFVSIENYLKALEYDNVKKSYTFSNLGRLYAELEDYEKQIEFSEKGRLAALEENIEKVHITCRLDIGRAYYKLGRIDESEKYLLETMPFIENSNSKAKGILLIEYLLRIANDREDWDKTLSLIKDTEKYKREWTFAFVCTEIGKAYFNKGELEEAAKWCEEGKQIGIACNRSSYIKAPCECLAEVYKKKGNYELALENLEMAKIHESSLNDKRKFINITRALNQKDLKQQAEMIRLEQEKKNKENEMQVFRMSLLTTFILLFSAFGIFLYYQLKKRNNKIAKQNNIIKKALADKDILLKEIHHRVKNNLQIVSSLLSMQMRHVKDIDAKRIIAEGRNRVQSMALIHQNLYQNETISQFSVTNYLEKLSEELFTTYNISQQNIELDLQIDPIDLDLDTMIPIGLILNELISNCLKHAFIEGNKGKITIIIAEKNNQLIIIVKDNGKGIRNKNLQDTDSFGNKLILAFTQKLKAEYKIENEEGTKVTVTINNYQKTT